MRSVIALVCLSVLGLAQSGFGTQRAITTTADGAWSVYATDLDGDGDADVLSASEIDDKIAWYENLGRRRLRSRSKCHYHRADGARIRVRDGPGRRWRTPTCSPLHLERRQDRVVREPGWGQPSVPQQVIDLVCGRRQLRVYATDLDGDGDADVLSASIIE